MAVISEKRVLIPDGVSVDIENGKVRVSGKNGEIIRELAYPGIKISREEKEVVVTSEGDRRIQKAMLGTFASHIKNMVKGVSKGFEYRMKIVYAHFPITVKVAGNNIIIENYLGEKIPRVVEIVGDCKVEVKGTELIITGYNIEHVGQTASRIEKATRVKKRDARVFQDGIYLVERKEEMQ
ncbi:MAG: 50S ribosomal protein L6 [Candidatus Hydrothermarchaeaceae archaeon]